MYNETGTLSCKSELSLDSNLCSEVINETSFPSGEYEKKKKKTQEKY